MDDFQLAQPTRTDMTSPSQLVAQGNDNSVIYQAAGSIIITARPTVPVADIPAEDIDTVRLAWVGVDAGNEPVDTAARVQRLLTDADGLGIAVVAGKAGSGRTAAAIKALWDAGHDEQHREASWMMQQITPDWEDPDTSMLPVEANRGYLLDVSAEIEGWRNPVEVATSFLAYARKLRAKGSYLVLVAAEHGWPADASAGIGRALVSVRRKPSARLVAMAHVRHLYAKPERAKWLAEKPAADGVEGSLGHLLTDSSSPADAASLARLVSDSADTAEGRGLVAAEFLQWAQVVQEVFAETERNPDDRALLIACLFLEREDPVTVQSSARQLLGDDKPKSVREILTGPDLTSRLASVEADVVSQRVTFDHRPGFSKAALHHLWRQRPDIQAPLMEWVKQITDAKTVSAGRFKTVSSLLADLAIEQQDLRPIEIARTWASADDPTGERKAAVTHMLGTAAISPAIGSKTRAQLLKWAQEPSSAIAEVPAVICQGEFAEHYPRQAMVRLRWILDRGQRDHAVLAAEEALRHMAAQPAVLPTVWRTVTRWLDKDEGLASRRAFLALIDSSTAPYSLQVLIAAAQLDDAVRDTLVSGWSSALADPVLDQQCKGVLTAWARTLADGQIAEDMTTEILNRVIEAHFLTSPISALLVGEPEVAYEPAVIALRRLLSYRRIHDTSAVADISEE